MKIRHYQIGAFLTIFVTQLLFMSLETGVICSLLFQMIGYEFQLITQIKMYLSLIDLLSIKVYCGMVNTLTIKHNA